MTAELEKELGAKPDVSWNISSGTFTDMNVVFPVASVSGMSVGDLEAKVLAAVTKSFGKPPEQLVVSSSRSNSSDPNRWIARRAAQPCLAPDRQAAAPRRSRRASRAGGG